MGAGLETRELVGRLAEGSGLGLSGGALLGAHSDGLRLGCARLRG